MRLDLALVNAPAQIVPIACRTAEHLDQLLHAQRCQIGAAGNAQGMHFRGRGRTDAMEFFDRQGGDEGLAPPRWDDEEIVRLAMARRHFGEEFVVADAGGRIKARHRQDAGPNRVGDVGCEGDVLLVFSNVEIGLVERERLDQIGVLGENLVNLHRDGPVDVESGRHEDQLGAFAHGGDGGHCRADAECPGLVAGRGHDAAPRAMPDRHRLAAKRGIVALLNGRVKSVHIDMYDLPDSHGPTFGTPIGNRRATPCQHGCAQSRRNQTAERSSFVL
jgi:hypothetical protein